jgi:CsbD-like
VRTVQRVSSRSPYHLRPKEIHIVDTNRVKGALDKAKGAIKEGVGNLTGDEKMKAEGAADKV